MDDETTSDEKLRTLIERAQQMLVMAERLVIQSSVILSETAKIVDRIHQNEKTKEKT